MKIYITFVESDNKSQIFFQVNIKYTLWVHFLNPNYIFWNFSQDYSAKNIKKDCIHFS
jgi:hypothetical protein